MPALALALAAQALLQALLLLLLLTAASLLLTLRLLVWLAAVRETAGPSQRQEGPGPQRSGGRLMLHQALPRLLPPLAFQRGRPPAQPLPRPRGRRLPRRTPAQAGAASAARPGPPGAGAAAGRCRRKRTPILHKRQQTAIATSQGNQEEAAAREAGIR
jgi:hypothetical protein